MKYNNINFILLRFIIFVLLISCGGAPKPVDTPPPAEETGTQPAATSPAPDPNQQPPGRDTLDALNTAMARAENARNKALDVQGPVYFPEDWKGAESKHEAGKNTKKDTIGGVNEAIALFNAAADAYDALAGKSVPLFAKDQEDAGNALNKAMARAEQSRKQALDNQGPVYFPNDWESAESSYKTGNDAKKDTLNEMKTAAALYNAAADGYDDIAGRSGPLLAKEKDDALKALNDAMARAEQSRKETLNVNGQAYFPKDWDAAESKNKAGKDAKKTAADEIKAAAALYVSAADTYDEITRKSRPLLAKEKDDAAKALNAAIARAEQSRKQALDVEGQTYFPNDWKNAESKHRAGKSAKKDTADDIKGATALYVSAADAFDAITGKSRPLLAKEKDDAAKALNAAIARAEQSRKQALDVEGQTYFPNDWKNAESKHQAGKDAKKTTAAEIKASAALYTTAADGYDDIVRKNNSRLAKEQEDAAKALNAAIAQMERSRKQALDNQAPAYFPKDWDAAESKNKAGKDAKKDTADEMKAAAALYISAADAYDWISGRSQSLLAKEKDDAAKALNAAIARAEQSRKQALDNQAPAYFPKDWDAAESKNKAGKDAKKTTAD
ncbi:MAG: hypothetical protein LBD55_08770, partial [Treponema sp.]|nr:hypothetical protein [Treponema sp.]